MDFQALDNLDLIDSGYVEYIWHKFYDNPNAVFENINNHTTWQYPECWLARYWLTYTLHSHLINDKDILEIGSNFNFYSVWSMLNGAKSVHGIEPDADRKKLGKEFLQIRGFEKQVHTDLLDVNQFLEQYDGKKYDIVFFQDVLYYLHNPIEVLHRITHQIKPKYMFLESTVTHDFDTSNNENNFNKGSFHVYYPSQDSITVQSYKQQMTMALTPSRTALWEMLKQDWKIISYYDYQDFVGHGESPPRKEGMKDFYVLERLNVDKL